MAASLKKLQPIHHEAITLRIVGLTYAQIAAKINRRESTVADWFSGEPLFQNAFAARKADVVERARIALENAAFDAAKNLIGLTHHEHGPTALGATKDVLDRAGLKPTDKIDASHEVRIVVEYGDADD